MENIARRGEISARWAEILRRRAIFDIYPDEPHVYLLYITSRARSAHKYPQRFINIEERSYKNAENY